MNSRPIDENEMSNELAQAVDSIAKTTVPQASVARLIESATQAGTRAIPVSTLPLTAGGSSRSRLWKLAMAASLAAVCLFFASGWFSSSNNLYASMQQVVSQFSTIKLVSTVIDDDGNILRSLNGFVDESGMIRQEGSDGAVMIVDFGQELAMEMVPATKKARIFPLYGTESSLEFFDAVLGLLRGEEVDSAREVARHEVDGTTLVEFEVEVAGQIANVFVDLNSSQPSRIELNRGASAPLVVIDQFVFDLPLAPELFLLEAPNDFEVTRVERPEPTDDTQLVLTPGVGLGTVAFGFTTAQVIEAFGESEQNYQVDSEVFIDGDWTTQKLDVLTYADRGLQIHIDPRHGVKTITAMRDSAGFSSKGKPFKGGLAAGEASVRMGDSLERVLELLGSPDETKELGDVVESLTYWDRENRLTTSIGFSDSKVVSFSSHKEF